ncbi:hypothetical protein L1887_21363 [Cichorium endivia]|nr:hypothetical protein L1887_21363 [Cichorium endivia]
MWWHEKLLHKRYGERLNGEEEIGIPGNPELHAPAEITIRGFPAMLRSKLNLSDTRPVIPLGHGDPSAFPCFRTSPIAEDAIIDTLRSSKFNGYSSTVGIPPARKYSLFFLICLSVRYLAIRKRHDLAALDSFAGAAVTSNNPSISPSA